jgi:hypothetical protein
LLHIGNFETGKRTNLRRAVDECVYTSRLYYNTEIYSEREKMNYLSLKHNDKLFEVKLYETHIAAFKEDVLNYINENNIVVTSENRDEVEQDLNDTLFTCDDVTGNASGSYTFNTWTAEEYLCHNWDLLGEALTDFGCDVNYLGRGAEACDVTIRCYLLGQAISEVLDEIETEEEEE